MLDIKIGIETANKNPTILIKPIKIQQKKDYLFIIYCSIFGILAGVFFGVLLVLLMNYKGLFLKFISHE